MKGILQNTPVLSAPDLNVPVLLQEGKDGFDHPVVYLSSKFNQNKKYFSIEKERLTLIMAIQKLKVYLS